MSLFILIVLNIVAMVSGTVEDIYNISPRAFIVFEAASVAVFTVEYLLRVWACTTDAKFARPVVGRLKFIVSPLALFDLMAILPFYIALLNLPGIDLRVVRAARLVGRVARLGRYSAGIRTLALVLQAKKDELLTRIHRWTGMDGVRTAEGGEGVTGAMIRARIWVDGRLAGGLQALLGAPMAAYSGCGERDGGIGHGKRRSRTGLARVCGDVGSVAEGTVRLGVEWLAAGPAGPGRG